MPLRKDDVDFGSGAYVPGPRDVDFEGVSLPHSLSTTACFRAGQAVNIFASCQIRNFSHTGAGEVAESRENATELATIFLEGATHLLHFELVALPTCGISSSCNDNSISPQDYRNPLSINDIRTGVRHTLILRRDSADFCARWFRDGCGFSAILLPYCAGLLALEVPALVCGHLT